MSILKEGVISSVENTVENTADVSSSLMSWLKLYCQKIDKSIGEMRSDLQRDREESESKFNFLFTLIHEVQRCVQNQIDNQGMDDTHKELAKFHLVQKDPSSSGVQNEERTSAPSSSGPKKGTETISDQHDHQQQQQVDPQVNQHGPQQPIQSLSRYQQWLRPHVSNDLFFKELIEISIRALEKVNADDETKLFIHVDLNKTYKSISVTYNGIGMTKAVLEKGDTHGAWRLFFKVANKILVTTKHNKDKQYVCKASRGDNCFKIDRDDTSTSLGRGTKITLFLEDDHLEYLEERRLKGLVDKFFKYIDYEITIRNYDSSNKYQSGLVHSSCSKPPLSSWYKVKVLSTLSETYTQGQVVAAKKEMRRKMRFEQIRS